MKKKRKPDLEDKEKEIVKEEYDKKGRRGGGGIGN